MFLSRKSEFNCSMDSLESIKKLLDYVLLSSEMMGSVCFFLLSGAHLNPAVSLSLCFLGRHPWVKLPFYVFSQVLGAFLAAATVGLQYYGETQICQIMHRGQKRTG